MKNLMIALVLMMGFQAKAIDMQTVVTEINKEISMAVGAKGMFDFKVGDKANYNFTMAFIPGKMSMEVIDVQPTLITLKQSVDMIIQKQDCTIKLDPNTGENKEIVCNGQQQQGAAQEDIEMVEQKEDTVTVPAGTFTCLYIKARQKSTNDNVEQWINPSEVPVFGLVKSVSPSPLGAVTMELTSFKKM